MEVRSSSPSSFRRSRSAIARTATVALSLVAGSLTLWSAPASAAPAPLDNAECVQVGTAWVNLLNFADPDASRPGTVVLLSTFEVVGNVLTVVVPDVPAVNVSYSDFFPTIEFWNRAGCSGPAETQVLEAEGYSVCVTASSDDGTVDSLDYRPFFLEDAGPPLIIAARRLDGIANGARVDLADSAEGWPLRKLVNLFNTSGFPLDINSDPIGNVTVTYTLGLGTCGGSHPEDGNDPGFDIDIDHYRKRAASETGALPDTL